MSSVIEPRKLKNTETVAFQRGKDKKDVILLSMTDNAEMAEAADDLKMIIKLQAVTDFIQHNGGADLIDQCLSTCAITRKQGNNYYN
jgi:hypothetical protein